MANDNINTTATVNPNPHYMTKTKPFYYGEDFEDSDDFYRFWTKKEASYKLGDNPESVYTTKFKGNFMLTVVSSGNIGECVEIESFV